MMEQMLKGGGIRGVSKKILDTVVSQYMQRMYYAAAKALDQPIEETPDIPANVDLGKYLRPLSQFPPRFVANVINLNNIPCILIVI